MRLRDLVPLVAALTLAGCHDWLVEAPEDFFTPDNFPASEADLKIALGGIDDWYTRRAAPAYFHPGWPMITQGASDQTGACSTTDSRHDGDSHTLDGSNEMP